MESGPVSVRLKPPVVWRLWWGKIFTVFYVGVLDLLEDFGPDGCVAFFVGVDAGGLEVEILADTAGALWSGCHFGG